MTDWSSVAERIDHHVQMIPTKTRWNIAVDRNGALHEHAPLLLRSAKAPDEPPYRALIAVLAAGARGKPMRLGDGLAAALGFVEHGNGTPGRRANRLDVALGYVLRQPRFLAARCYAKKVALPAGPLLQLLLDLSDNKLSKPSKEALSEADAAMHRLKLQQDAKAFKAMSNAL